MVLYADANETEGKATTGTLGLIRKSLLEHQESKILSHYL